MHGVRHFRHRAGSRRAGSGDRSVGNGVKPDRRGQQDDAHLVHLTLLQHQGRHPPCEEPRTRGLDRDERLQLPCRSCHRMLGCHSVASSQKAQDCGQAAALRARGMVPRRQGLRLLSLDAVDQLSQDGVPWDRATKARGEEGPIKQS